MKYLIPTFNLLETQKNTNDLYLTLRIHDKLTAFGWAGRSDVKSFLSWIALSARTIPQVIEVV